MEYKDILDLLDKELIVALGCTEPAAIALAAAVARKHLKGADLVTLEVIASGNIIKNAMGVNIPGTGQAGMKLAAALGSLGDPEKGLEVLCGLSKEDIERAEEMVQEGRTSIRKADSPKKLYIEAVARSAEGYSRVVIEDRHSNITHIEADGVSFLCGGDIEPEEDKSAEPFLSIDAIWDFVEKVDTNLLGKVDDSIKLNTKVANEGLKNRYGLQVGKTLFESMAEGPRSNDVVNYAIALTAAASDARMDGCSLSVMSNTGSGNQGITATMPVVAFWEKLGLSYDSLLRAAALSHLMTIHIKLKFGRLSALCGASIAATGASCGITYLMGGGKEEVKAAIQNMLGNITGMVCDGAKSGCALKVATCTSAACMSATLAMKGLGIGCKDGIIENDVEKTIDHLCRIGNEGSLEIDRIILDIMLNKKGFNN